MGAAAVPLQIAGMGLDAFGQIQAGKAEERIANYNAAVIEQEGLAAEEKAEFDEALHRERVRKALSTQKAAAGASGVEVSGSAALGLEESAIQGELDALVIRHGGQIEKARSKQEAAFERVRGKQARKASIIGAGTSLLTGGAKVAQGGK